MEFLTSTAGSLIIFVIGLAIFIALCFTKVPRIYAVLLAVLVFAFGINAEWTTSLFTTFLGGTVTVIQSYLFTTLSGAAVGCALAATGCANRIAETVMNLVGRQRGALVIMIVSFLVCASGGSGHTWIVLPIALGGLPGVQHSPGCGPAGLRQPGPDCPIFPGGHSRPAQPDARRVPRHQHLSGACHVHCGRGCGRGTVLLDL